MALTPLWDMIYEEEAVPTLSCRLMAAGLGTPNEGANVRFAPMQDVPGKVLTSQ